MCGLLGKVIEVPRTKSYPGRACDTGDHNDGADRAVLGDETSRAATTNNQYSGPIEYSKRTHLVVSTRMAPAFCSRLALTAAIQHVSVVGTGVGASFLISSKALTYGIGIVAFRSLA